MIAELDIIWIWAYNLLKLSYTSVSETILQYSQLFDLQATFVMACIVVLRLVTLTCQ